MAFSFLQTLSGANPPTYTGVTVGSGGVTAGDIVVGGGTNKVVRLAATTIAKTRHFLATKTAASGSTTNLILLTPDVILSCTGATGLTLGAIVEVDFTAMAYGTTVATTAGNGGLALLSQYSEQTGPATATTKYRVLFVQGM